MTTQQEVIDHDVRMMLGDLQLQLIMARGRIAELESALAAKEPTAPAKANGKDNAATKPPAPAAA